MWVQVKGAGQHELSRTLVRVGVAKIGRERKGEREREREGERERVCVRENGRVRVRERERGEREIKRERNTHIKYVKGKLCVRIMTCKRDPCILCHTWGPSKNWGVARNQKAPSKDLTWVLSRYERVVLHGWNIIVCRTWGPVENWGVATIQEAPVTIREWVTSRYERVMSDMRIHHATHVNESGRRKCGVAHTMIWHKWTSH